MIALDRLETWVQPQHLEPAALSAHRDAFGINPARLLVLPHFLLDVVAEKLNRFFAREAAFEVAYGLYSAEDQRITPDEWRRADEADRFFRHSQLIGPRPEFRLSSNLVAFLRFRGALNGESFRAYFEQIAGVPLGPSSVTNVNAMRQGDFLRSHSDNFRSYRLAAVLYLSPGWRTAFGGTLRLIERNGRVTHIDATYNSLVIFDVTVGTTHLITPIEAAAGDQARITLSGWIRSR